ncbi:MAG: hypothetical protein GY810_07545 [Aureispira sp.]|nr:hypothetical protein [Aureispira sp.]
MKLQLLLILLLTTVLHFNLIAQADSKVSVGVASYQSEDYEKAIENLNTALADPTQLKSKNVPKAYYYRAMSYLAIFRKFAIKKNAEGLEKYHNAKLDAYNDLKQAKENDSKGKYKSLVEKEILDLYPPLLNSGLYLVSSSYDKSLTASNKQAIHDLAVQYLNVCIEIKPTNYYAYEFLGQLYHNKYFGAEFNEEGLIKETLPLFQKALENAQADKNRKPDQLITYTCYRLALIHRYAKKDLDVAFEYITLGKKILEEEHQKLVNKKQEHTDANWAKVEQQYNNCLADMNAFELDLYLNSPEKLKEALTKFEEAIKKRPNDDIVHIAYAQLLEKVDVEKSIAIYKKAIVINPESFMAHFNLGAVYNNIAKEYYDKANEEEDYDKAKVWQKKVDESFKLALAPFQQAHEIDPTDLSTVRALKQITIKLEMMEEYQKYKAIETELTKN